MSECPISLDTYNDKERKPIVLVPCGHSICEECLEKLTNKVCPVDRKPFTSTTINYSLIGSLNDKTASNSSFAVPKLSIETPHSGKFIWSWQRHSNGPHFKPYLNKYQSQIENAYLSYQNNNRLAILKFNSFCRDDLQDYEIDFTRMLQINSKTQYTRKILRKQSGEYQWYYYCHGWKPYDSNLQSELDDSYLDYINNKNLENAQINVFINNIKYSIDFKNLKQKNLENGRERYIRRS